MGSTTGVIIWEVAETLLASTTTALRLVNKSVPSSVGTGDLSPELRMYGGIPPLPHTSLWNFTSLYLYILHPFALHSFSMQLTHPKVSTAFIA
jgi:hypothetical protein